ncbi:methyltransferase domain-containing protein [Cohnella hashimotonis]|uniref:Methyltransferase domain-containing protein n=1 Tax=Cohnella hashimotonis TaxID=2826895 RepID=A0ABT6TJ61_9BACL|nr:methyltransferase domain-containing protein [Cohnella hashimotonis]MDI4645984.1 methyltransferase domain-containing protein [Cohnella hashimotonis]
MFKLLKTRAKAPELMDDLAQGGAELREALRHLRRLNRLFAASGRTLYGVVRLWEHAGRPKRLTVLDIGAGSGDVNAALLRWAEAHDVTIGITLVDRTEEACAEARAFYAGEPRIHVMRSDLFDLEEAVADIVTASQFVHHFEDEELPDVARAMLRASKVGIVIQDIHRHWLAWTAVWLAARLVSGNRYVVNDGPLSVAKGFRASDWERLRVRMGENGFAYSWRPLFRYVVTVPKTARPTPDYGPRSGSSSSGTGPDGKEALA